MMNVLREVSVPESGRKCSTCGHGEPTVEFYASGNECKDCKKDRSRRNRADQARKIAALERLIDVLFVLADRTSDPPVERKQKAVA
jgi:hypothetical protein